MFWSLFGGKTVWGWSNQLRPRDPGGDETLQWRHALPREGRDSARPGQSSLIQQSGYNSFKRAEWSSYNLVVFLISEKSTCPGGVCCSLPSRQVGWACMGQAAAGCLVFLFCWHSSLQFSLLQGGCWDLFPPLGTLYPSSKIVERCHKPTQESKPIPSLVPRSRPMNMREESRFLTVSSLESSVSSLSPSFSPPILGLGLVSSLSKWILLTDSMFTL